MDNHNCAVSCGKSKCCTEAVFFTCEVVDQTMLMVLILRCVRRSSCEVSAHRSTVRPANCRLTSLLRVSSPQRVGEKAVMHVEHALLFFLHAHALPDFPSFHFLPPVPQPCVCALCVRVRAGVRTGGVVVLCFYPAREHCHRQ
jgi:hypothetical protein